MVNVLLRSRSLVVAAVSMFTLLSPLHPSQATVKSTPSQCSSKPPKFAFWYEPWDERTWDKISPANVAVGVPASAVHEIHSEGGRALNYVTFYQSNPKTAFLYDLDDLKNVGFHHDGSYLPSVFGGKDNFTLCPNSVELRRRALAYVRTTLGGSSGHDPNAFDGLFIDNAIQPPASSLVCDAHHPHESPGKNGAAAYVSLLKDVYAQAKATNPCSIVIVNPGSPKAADAITDGEHSLWDYADYILWESFGHSSELGEKHDRWEVTFVQAFELKPSIDAGRILVLSYPRTQAEALFAYGAAKIFGFTFAANVGERAPDEPGGHFGTFRSGLPDLQGRPLDPRPKKSTKILERHYRNGMVVLNRSRAGFRFSASGNGVFFSEEGNVPVKKGQRLEVGPGKACVFVRSHQ